MNATNFVVSKVDVIVFFQLLMHQSILLLQANNVVLVGFGRLFKIVIDSLLTP